MCIILPCVHHLSSCHEARGGISSNQVRPTRSAAPRFRRSHDSPGCAAGNNTDHRDVALQTVSHENGNDLALVSVLWTSPDRTGIPSHVPGGAPGDIPLPVRRPYPREGSPSRFGPGPARRSSFPSGTLARIPGANPVRTLIPLLIQQRHSLPALPWAGSECGFPDIGSGCPSSRLPCRPPARMVREACHMPLSSGRAVFGVAPGFRPLR